MIGLPREALEAASRRLHGDYEEDEWGFDPGFASAAEPLLAFLYERWWRIHTSGLEHVPAAGGALIVANHAGVLPWEAAMIATAIRRERTPARDARFLVLDWAGGLPWASTAIRRLGGVRASPHNALRLLEAGHLVVVFPEGAGGAGKPWSRRYRLQGFGRGGFVSLALRTGAPIIPCAVVGSEDIYPKLAGLPGASRLLKLPHLPLTPTFPLLGPLGAVPLPARWRIAFGAPIRLAAGADSPEDRTTVLEVAAAVREQIQKMVYEGVVRRGRTFW